MTRAFEIRGWHVLAALVAFFLVVVGANAIFIAVALNSFPGEEESKPYLQGVHYNERLQARRMQAALGWTASIDAAEIKGEGAVIEMSFRDRKGEPVVGLDVEGRLFRPADDNADQALRYSPIGMGRYRAEIERAAPGVWVLEGTARNRNQQSLDFRTRLIFE